jgi:tetratricopeptide (TPR) repeat protein
LKLSVGEIEKISEHKIENFQVYECYLKSRQDLWKYSEESLKRAEQNLKNGLHVFGDHELLLVGLGQVYFQFYDSGIKQDEEFLNKVEECANKILKIEPNSASAYQLSGLLKMKRENALSAFRDFQKSYNLNPSDPETLLWMIYILCFHIGQPSKAIRFIEKVLKLDPLTPTNQSLPAIYHWMEGRFEKSLFHFNKWIEMEPDSVLANWYIGQLLLISKKKEAFNFIEGMWQNNPEGLFSRLLRLLEYALDGRIKETLQLINEEVRQVAWNDFHLGWYIADCYALIEEKEQAIKWLEHAVAWGLINYPLLSEIDPLLENIRGEPRFKKLMKRVKKEWENFEV